MVQPLQVLVIGASRGIGRQFVRQYLAEGAAVTATARAPADVDALAAEGAKAFALDVADAAGTADAARRFGDGAFDIVLYVAGVYGPATTQPEPPSRADFDAVMHANVLGAMQLLPGLAEALAPGAKLAVLSSRMGSIGLRDGSAGWLYRASKAALNSVLKDIALTLAARGAVGVALHPGWVQTDMGGAEAALTPERSVADMRRTLAGLAPADNGSFLNHDGTPLAW